jgi:hypothetical protein
MRIECDRGKMTGPRMRLYHSMYQLFVFAMLLALLTNNMGILWGLCQLVEIETEPPQVRHSFRSRSTDFGLLR